jgi:hypothetical protein
VLTEAFADAGFEPSLLLSRSKILKQLGLLAGTVLDQSPMAALFDLRYN